MSDRLDNWWYGKERPLGWLGPLASLYGRLVARRQRKFAEGSRESYRCPLPVIVVGNITVGGTGKSPLTAWLVGQLRRAGWRPVILTRGYGGTAGSYPIITSARTPAEQVGDEAVMLARQTGAAVVVDPQRARAARYVVKAGLGNIIVCDDGLQHYALQRDIEIAVVDGQRGLGNGALLPVGPLREPPGRLERVDLRVVNGEPLQSLPGDHWYGMELVPDHLENLLTGEIHTLDWLAGRKVDAVAGIGNPGRFFAALEALGAQVKRHPKPDHHSFVASDLDYPESTVVITAKDSVKCSDIGHTNVWVLNVKVRLDEDFLAALKGCLEARGLAPPKRKLGEIDGQEIGGHARMPGL